MPVNHTPTHDRAVYRCPACSFRAVALSDGHYHVIDGGSGRQQHLAAIDAERAAYAHHLTQRLARRWTTERGCSLETLQRLMRHVIEEYGI